MILVADSGSSKTDWIGYSPDEKLVFSTQGINPYFLNAHDIYKILAKKKELAAYVDKVREIYFFGAGCSSPDKIEVMSNGISSFFTNAYVAVEHDLLGSAFATCGDKEGLTCILGTGSNICYFDGADVHSGSHGLGYALGDEGSGTSFGRKLITSYLYGQMPPELGIELAQKYDINKESVITNVYQRPSANIYLASISKFMAAHLDHPFIQTILREGFQEFVDTNIKDYPDYKNLDCHFVGSIAYYYQDVLKAVCEANGVKVGKILQKPIEEIYHYILKREGILI
ncbi:MULTISPECIES: N-acetylglucosamine kinase [Pedobacter]|uniref:N-acetylglucosamine kinase n=1 Tax=Pedobacter TaxID=84567 RepID=UPI00210BA430|nr:MULTISPECIES: N-acetylglucosamine kinase [unclassified Pedobacter]